MKAITTKYLGFTNTKPSRIKVSAEGVKPLTISIGKLEHVTDKDTFERNNIHICAAKHYARLHEQYGWSTDLASGGTENPDVWVHCFVSSGVPAPVAVTVNDTLASALKEALPVLRERCSNSPEDTDRYNKARLALELAKPFLRGSALVVACARTFVAESYPSQPAKSNGDKACSGYHFELLRNALNQLNS